MLYLNDAVDAFIALLEANAYFKGIRVVKAFANTTFETLPESAYIAVGISEMKFSPASAGQSAQAGDLRFFADIFLPYSITDSAAAAQEILSEICTSVADCGVLSISVGKPYADSSTGCTVVESTFQFSDVIYFGGRENE